MTDENEKLEQEIDEAEAKREKTHPPAHEAPVNLAAGGYGGGPRTTRAARRAAERED